MDHADVLAGAPVAVRVLRDGVAESVHRGHAAVVDSGGRLLGSLGDPTLDVYVRSAAKPFQALPTIDLAAAGGVALDPDAVAIAAASHSGSDTHQIEVARLLALADLDETALRCPPTLPADVPTLLRQGVPTALAHNCSGKHAGFLLAQRLAGGDPAGYLDPRGAVQRLVRERLEEVTGTTAAGPGVDGCGAPAWRLPLAALATAFGRLALPAGDDPCAAALTTVRNAMISRPDLIGAPGLPDTELMLADARVVAKRGAEAVLAAGFWHPSGLGLGIAVKVADGAARAAAPLLGTLLAGLGAGVPAAVREPPVFGAGRPVGHLETTHAVRTVADALPVAAR